MFLVLYLYLFIYLYYFHGIPGKAFWRENNNTGHFGKWNTNRWAIDVSFFEMLHGFLCSISIPPNTLQIWAEVLSLIFLWMIAIMEEEAFEGGSM